MRFKLANICVWLFLAGSAMNVAAEPVSLMGTIAPWRYPKSSINHAKGSDAATIDAEGNRTVRSTVFEARMTTEASVDEVLQHYRELLTRNPEHDTKLSIQPNEGRSVVFCDESEGRPFELHVILVNSKTTSTTLIVSREPAEQQTRISWKQYSKYPITADARLPNAPGQNDNTADE